ncbi:MAG: GntR family transcriptional regulator [Acidimicrobiales bacterium]
MRTIRVAIIQGKLRPGEKIPELELAAQLGVSRTPVREAIRTLEEQGLVETRPKSGTFVARLQWQEARDSLLVRAAIEELAVRQAIERLDGREWDDLCATLERVLAGMREAIERNDPIAATEHDVEWHTLLVDAAHNRYLSRTWRIVGVAFLIWSPERELYPIPRESWPEVFARRHEKVLEALRARDPDQAGAAVRHHVSEKLHDLIEGIPGVHHDRESSPTAAPTGGGSGGEGSV